jgi:uncharacterized protein
VNTGRLLPDISHPDFAPYWAGCARRKLLVPQCRDGHLVWPPRPACLTCTADIVGWQEIEGKGKLYSWTIVHRTRLQWFAERTPYVVGIIAVDHEQPLRMIGRCQVQHEQLHEGLPLAVDFEFVNEDVTIPFWRVDASYRGRARRDPRDGSQLTQGFPSQG